MSTGKNCRGRLQRMAVYLSAILILLCVVTVVAVPGDPGQPKPSQTAPPGNRETVPPSSQPPVEAVENFWADTVFLGDSVTMALRNYHLKTGVLEGARFLCAGSYGLRHAVGDRTVSVTAEGKAVLPQQALAQWGTRRVFVMLGMNDLAFGMDKALENWAVLLENLEKSCPGLEVYIQSATPIAPAFEGKMLNNANLDSYNAQLRRFAAQKGCVYVDVASALKDSAGALGKEFCSDGKCHLTEAAVRVWLEILEKTAEEGI